MQRTWRWVLAVVGSLAVFLGAWLAGLVWFGLDAGTAVQAAGTVGVICCAPLLWWAGREQPDPAPPISGQPPSLPPPAVEVVAVSPVVRVPLRNRHFVGRESLLDAMHEGLTVGSAVAVQALHGLGGVGKTQLAIEYAHRFAGDYDVAWWIDAEQAALIPAQFTDLATSLGVEVDAGDAAAAVGVVRSVLGSRGRWLLVFDNAEHPAEVVEFLPEGGNVIVTSRNPGWAGLGMCIDVDVMTRDESVRLLMERSAGVGADIAGAIAGLLGDLPLAIEQAAAYLGETGMPAAEYLVLLRERGEELLTRGYVLGRDVAVATVWDVSARRVRESEPAAATLLQWCAFLGPEPIPLDLLTDHPDELPEPLDAVARDRLRWADVVGVLVRYSLVRRTEGGIVLHRLVQAAIRRSLSPEVREATHQQVVALLRGNLPGEIVDRPDSWRRWQQLLPHVLATTGVVPSAAGDQSSSGAIAWLLDRAGAYLRVLGQPAQARPLLERAVASDEASYGPDHPEVASHLGNLALVLGDLGLPGEARPLLERALVINEASYGPAHPEVAINLSNLAAMLRDLGLLGEARPLLERALAIGVASYGPDHPAVANGLGNLAVVLGDLGLPGEARPLLERAVAIGEASYGPDHPAVANGLSNLAAMLRHLGLPGEARPLLERAVAIGEASYGPDHPEVASHLGNLAVVLGDLGLPGEARPLLERAVAINEASYGPDHPAVANGLSNLAVMLRHLGLPGEARPLLERAVAIGEASYGPDHPEVASHLGNLAVVLGDLGLPGEAQIHEWDIDSR